MSDAMGGRLLSVNPIWQKSLRSRLRVRHMLSWGVVTLTITAFVFLITYTTMTEQEMASGQDAAKATIPGVIVIQGILLMAFGSGAVSSGIATERDKGLVDYQRMTPMSPTAKILGYMFGLPAREYFLFALTLPFVAIAVAISDFSLLTLGHFYLVFFTSVWVYHMTALVAGMVAPRPIVAALISFGLVAALYFVLPNLSRVGITYFEFLTIRPTFFGLLQQELPESMRAQAEASGIDSFRAVPFFTGMMHPTGYTLLVQGSLLAIMFWIVHRKWREQSNHVFSKLSGVLAYGGVVFFLLASLWPLLTREDVYWQVFQSVQGGFRTRQSPQTLEMLLMLAMGILGVMYVVVIGTATPSRHKAIEGRRRALKLGRRSVGLNSDAASSLPLGLAMLVLTIATGAALLVASGRTGAYFVSGPSAGSVLVLVSGVLGVGLFTQGLREVMGVRAFGVVIFLLWMVPFFAMMIMMAAFEAFVPASYVGLACPPVTLGYGIAAMLETTTPVPGERPQFVPGEVAGEAGTFALVGSVGYAAAAVMVQGARWAQWRSLGVGRPGLAARPGEGASAGASVGAFGAE